MKQDLTCHTKPGNASMPNDLIKLSESERQISQSPGYRSMVRAHRAMSWRLFWLITASVLLLDIASSFAPQMINIPLLPGTLFSLGFAIAFGTIGLIFAVSLYYLHWISQYRNRIGQDKPPQ